MDFHNEVFSVNGRSSRRCPICGGQAVSVAFPYATRFDNVLFNYLKCGSCASVFVDPVPDESTFELMFAKSAYHDSYYTGSESEEHSRSAKLLRSFLPPRAAVLDYGCGLGGFLKALEREGIKAAGVEFDADAAEFAAKNTGCPIIPTEKFFATDKNLTYDAIHIGNVLGHLPDPGETLRCLLAYVKPGGLLFVEGPLESNPSPVYWAARMFGVLKRRLNPALVSSAPPWHLFRVDAAQQLAFFTRVEPRLEQLHWEVYETGWPYAGENFFKRTIAAAAFLLSGRRLMGTTFGSQFRGIFRVPGSIRSLE